MPHRFSLTPAKRECLPSCMDALTAVVVAQVDDCGRLMQANAGFCRLLNLPTGPAPGVDVRHFFVNPSFEQLMGVHAEPGPQVFAGLLHVADALGGMRSLLGTVHVVDQRLSLVAEHDVAELERLNAQVMALNDELAEVQRQLARANRAVRASEEQLRQLSLTDALTGLANRRRLMTELEQSWQRFVRYGSVFSVIMVDVDFFKRVNDQFGHAQGDVVLQAVAGQMQSMVRKVDLVARYGGEEFVVVMHESAWPEAAELAERLRLAVAALSLAGLPQGVTCSCGVAQVREDQDVDVLLQRADAALYQAKHMGRNRVLVAPQ
jgi:diguanylate cyclase (GGDEF)-like protein